MKSFALCFRKMPCATSSATTITTSPRLTCRASDTYIEKDSSINDEIDKLRHSATKALLERRDTLIVASVSCIYGLGSPEAYFDLMVYLEEGTTVNRDQMLRKLVDIQYQRSDYDFHRGTFRVRGDIVEIFPAYEDRSALRIEFFDETIEVDQRDRPDSRQDSAAGRQGDDLSGEPLRYRARPLQAGGAGDSPGAERALKGAARAAQIAGSAALAAAHALRSGTAGRDGFLPRHRKLFAPLDRAPAGRAAADVAQLFSQRFSC